MFLTCPFVRSSVRPSVRPSVRSSVKTCDRYSLETNEPTVMQIGTSGARSRARGADLRESASHRSRSQEAEVRFGSLVEAPVE